MKERVNVSKKLPTYFLPAERLGRVEIKSQAKVVEESLLRAPPISLILNSVPDPIVILNKQRQIVVANKAFSRLTDHQKAPSFLGLRPGEALDCVHAFETEGGCGTTLFCTQCGAAKAIWESQKGKTARQECRISRKNGEALEFSVVSSPLVIGKKPFTLFSLVDISHEKRRRSLERIFFHDVLNTAGALWGFTSLFDHAEDGKREDLINRIKLVSKRLIDEIEGQRELSSAESGELVIKKEGVDVGPLLEEVVSFYRAHSVAVDKIIKLSTNIAKVIFKTDPVLLRRVVSNMLKNALEASQPGETVTVGMNQCGSEGIRVWVQNPAVMSPSVQLQVFQRSFSTKGEGRGLGTFSMKLLGEKYLKGLVSFTSDKTNGTIFSIQLGKRNRCTPIEV